MPVAGTTPRSDSSHEPSGTAATADAQPAVTTTAPSTASENVAPTEDATPPANASASPPSVPTGTPAAIPEIAPADPAPTLDPAHSEYHHHDEYHDHYHDPHHDYHHEHHGGEYQYPGLTDAGGGAGASPPGGAVYHAPEPEPEPEPEEEGGGPVKSFLEHLEDFRWLIIKCATAIMVTMVVCLLGVNHLVAIMKWPLKRAALIHNDSRQWVSVKLGPKELVNFRTDTNSPAGFLIGTNKYVELELVPIAVGTNRLLALQVRTNSNELPPEKELPLLYKGPADPFLASLHLAFFGGLLIAAPFVFYYLAQFLLPAMRERERKYFLKALTPAVVLFVTGVSLCYFVILPLALKAAEAYSKWMGVDMQFWHADDYFGFVTKFMLGMGLGFEMPVILLALVKIGLLNYTKLAGWRRHMIVINLVLGALLTTPEVLTQVSMFIPLQILYETTIWIAWYWEQEDRVMARRRLALAVIVAIVVIVLLVMGIKFAWPWILSLLK